MLWCFAACVWVFVGLLVGCWFVMFDLVVDAVSCLPFDGVACVGGLLDYGLFTQLCFSFVY